MNRRLKDIFDRRPGLLNLKLQSIDPSLLRQQLLKRKFLRIDVDSFQIYGDVFMIPFRLR